MAVTVACLFCFCHGMLSSGHGRDFWGHGPWHFWDTPVLCIFATSICQLSYWSGVPSCSSQIVPNLGCIHVVMLCVSSVTSSTRNLCPNGGIHAMGQSILCAYLGPVVTETGSPDFLLLCLPSLPGENRVLGRQGRTVWALVSFQEPTV